MLPKCAPPKGAGVGAAVGGAIKVAGKVVKVLKKSRKVVCQEVDDCGYPLPIPKKIVPPQRSAGTGMRTYDDLLGGK